MRLCARSASTPPFLAWVGAAYVRARVLALPRLSWPGFVVLVCSFGIKFWLHPTNPCWGDRVCVLVCALCLHPVNPGWGVRCPCVCVGWGFGFTPPVLSRVLECVCVVCALRLYSANPGWVVQCVCLDAGFGFRPPILARVCGVCIWVPVLLSPCQSSLGCCGVRVCLRAPSIPRLSWLGFLRVTVRVSGYRFRLHPANVGWGLLRGCVCLGLGFGFSPPILAGVWVCVFSCRRSACTPPMLAMFCGVCVGVQIVASRRESWLRFMVGVSELGCRFHPAHPGWGIRLCAFVCVLRLYPAYPG